jgi:predicted Zn-dependent protease
MNCHSINFPGGPSPKCGNAKEIAGVQIPVKVLACIVACCALMAQQRQREAALGARLAGELRRQSTLLDTPTVRDYVNRLGARLAAQFPDQPPAYHFEILVESTAVQPNELSEPIAFPGGSVFVPSALFLSAGDEAEFAGMLAHAMSHAAQPQEIRNGSIPLVYTGSWTTTGSSALPVAFLRTARGLELQADLLAVQVMARAGFDPAALMHYIARTQHNPPSRPAQFSALPPRDRRVANLESIIRRLPARSYSSTGEYDAVRDEVRRLTERPPRPAPSLQHPR